MIWGTFDFNRTPMGPPGCKIIVHDNQVKHRSWEFNGLLGIYVGPFMNGCHTYKVYTPKERAERSADTVIFFTQ